MNSSSNNDPNLDELIQATSEFSEWIKTATPGAILFVCGGLALAMHGNNRSTTDADLAIDLSRTCRPNSNRPYNTNALKGLVAMNPDKFIVGPKIYQIVNARTAQEKHIQVDFVNVNLYWTPFRAESMVNFSFDSIAHPLNLCTLLVSKMRSTIECSQPDAEDCFTKQSNDVQ
ncbi:hypothetical protein J132_09338 [Termitomyces sp. J132]|nr:hypothetical protein H2248_002791 [Termitomyces sp. 'cryptogamus']KNZ76594.1 hypothetical protein J132_09338 [Termitomyces sp. J132]